MIVHKMEQGSMEWFEIRNAKLTGSVLKDVGKSAEMKRIYTLIGEEGVGYVEQDDEYLSDAMLWGREMESLARPHYEQSNNCKIIQSGFLQPDNPDYHFFGLSPDGHIEEPDDSITGVEIKGLATWRHIQFIDTGKIPTDAQCNHLPQCMGWFLLDQRVQRVKFISHDERYALKKQHVITLNRCDVLPQIEVMKIELDKFRAKWLQIREKVTF